jgi:hypothetical protein
MYKFATSTLFAASAMAARLHITADSNNGGPPGTGDGPSIFERVELIHEVIDQNNDDVVSISELAEALILAETMTYIDHDTAKDVAYAFMHMHATFGDVIKVE